MTKATDPATLEALLIVLANEGSPGLQFKCSKKIGFEIDVHNPRDYARVLETIVRELSPNELHLMKQFRHRFDSQTQSANTHVSMQKVLHDRTGYKAKILYGRTDRLSIHLGADGTKQRFDLSLQSVNQ